MTEQDNKMEGSSIDQKLWLTSLSLLSQRPNIEEFPPDQISIPTELKPREVEILNSCFEDGDPPEDWKEIFSTLMPINPNNKFLWMRLGQYYREQELDRTIMCWERVLLIDPQRPFMHDNLGDVYEELAGDEYRDSHKSQRDELGLTKVQCEERAFEHWREAAILFSDIHEIWHGIGSQHENVMLQDERVGPDLAIMQYRKVLRFKPDFVPSMVRLGWLLARSGIHDGEAVELLVKARGIDPDCVRSIDYMQAIVPIGMNRPGILSRIQQKVSDALKSN